MINIFCLPFAGGSRYSYNGMAAKAPGHIRFLPVELPGRGSRYGEDLLFDIDHLVEDVFGQIRDSLCHPYALYGHSMGSLMVYLLAHKILDNGLRAPERLFVSGCNAPSRTSRREAYSLLPRDSFYEKIRSYGGCPDEVLQDGELMVFFEPILRADFQAVESYRYIAGRKFNIPIEVWLGTEEQMTREDGMAWQSETLAGVTVRLFNGRHFFIFEHERELTELMAKALAASNYAI